MTHATPGGRPVTMHPAPAGSAAFEEFFRETEPKLRRALVAAYGLEEGRDAAAEALAYAWEHWERLRDIANVAGYLYRVGQSRRRRRRLPVLWETPGWVEHRFEPGLPSALAALSQRQRVAVVLVHGYGYTLREVADLTGIKQTTVQNHAERGLAHLRARLGVNDDS